MRISLRLLKNVSECVCVLLCRMERELKKGSRKFEELKQAEHNLQQDLVLQRGLTQNAKQVQTMTHGRGRGVGDEREWKGGSVP